MHEFKMTPFSNGTSVLITVFQPRQYDLTTNPRFNVERGMGWVVEGVFQEIEIESGRLLFEWRSLDHVDPGESWMMPGTTDTSGDSLHEQSPWDYFHLNSIDKNVHGDYLISARHTSAIYKLSGKDGSITWQMGGVNPMFEQTNFVFSYQHHARWVSENHTHTLLSFFDNANNAYNSSGQFSHGWIVSIDHETKTATRIMEWGAPESQGGLQSGSQGNLQLLPDGGCHIGWGEHAAFSEHTADGTPVMYGKLAKYESGVMIYRSNKYNWTAQPATKPALWTYSRYGRGAMVYYVSWNGATEVRSWNFYTSDSPSGPWTFVAGEPKTSFETVHQEMKFSLWAYAQALDTAGRVLADSVIARTFVPSRWLRRHCDNEGCSSAEAALKDQVTPYEADIHVSEQHLSPNQGFNTSQYYYVGVPSNSTELRIVTPVNSGASKTTVMMVVTVTPDGSSSDGYIGSSVFILVLGIAVGFGLGTFGMFGMFVIHNGALKRLFGSKTKSLHDATKSVFGVDVRGKYQRLRNEKELDSMDFASCSSRETIHSS